MKDAIERLHKIQSVTELLKPCPLDDNDTRAISYAIDCVAKAQEYQELVLKIVDVLLEHGLPERDAAKGGRRIKQELHQCPCCNATECLMDEPCLGCETYSEWLVHKE